MIHFHPLAVKEVKKETADCVSVCFDVPEALKDIFSFAHGQNLTLKKTINGEELRRSYSICSAVGDNELKVAIKKVEHGVFSGFANEELKAGDMIEVMPPTGKFNTALNAANKKSYLAFAAGSGITPVLSIIKTTLQTEPGSSFTLLYGNRDKNSIIFKEALEALKDRFLSRFTLIHILSREITDTPLNSGRIDAAKLKQLNKIISFAGVDEFFICGPETMIFCVNDFLTAAGIEKKKIHFELFTTPGQKTTTGDGQQTTAVSAAGSKITVKLDGRSFDFEIPQNSNTSILDAALKQGADLPFACKGGVCCTCKARLTEGQVKMDVRWGLEDDEIEQGYILTCQSHPVSEKVVVDYDVK